jgi:hygromycin-B 7''-O-kinase
LAGESYGTVRERLSVENRRDVARFIADVTTRVHTLIPGPNSELSRNWTPWDAFIATQMRTCAERHRAWGTLPEHLIEQIEPYLKQASDLLVHPEPPAVLHCDLTADHVFGAWEGETWVPTGIIDFGDAKIGDRRYDLVALHIESFGGDKDMLRAYLECYGFDVGRRPDFARQAMHMTLLHEFNVLETVFEFMPEARRLPSLDQLATALWDVNAYPKVLPEGGFHVNCEGLPAERRSRHQEARPWAIALANRAGESCLGDGGGA